MKIPVLGLLAILICSTSLAEEEKAIAGWGAAPCGYIFDRQEDESSQATQMLALTWAQGYLTGINQAVYHYDGQLLELNAPDEMFKWLRNYCSGNRLESFLTACAALWNELATRQGIDRTFKLPE
jgi:hypothetical protein